MPGTRGTHPPRSIPIIPVAGSCCHNGTVAGRNIEKLSLLTPVQQGDKCGRFISAGSACRRQRGAWSIGEFTSAFVTMRSALLPVPGSLDPVRPHTLPQPPKPSDAVRGGLDYLPHRGTFGVAEEHEPPSAHRGPPRSRPAIVAQQSAGLGSGEGNFVACASEGWGSCVPGRTFGWSESGSWSEDKRCEDRSSRQHTPRGLRSIPAPPSTRGFARTQPPSDRRIRSP